jgi:hypothetical protein
MSTERPNFKEAEVPKANSDRFQRKIEALNQLRPTGDPMADIRNLLHITGYEAIDPSFSLKPEEGIRGAVDLGKKLLKTITSARPWIENDIQRRLRETPADRDNLMLEKEISQAEESALRAFIAHYDAEAGR